MNRLQAFFPVISGEHSQTEKQHYLQTIERNPQDDESHHRLALLLFEMGDRPGAENHLRLALQLNPNSAAAHYDLGALLREDGRTAEANKEFDWAWRIDPLARNN